MYPLMVENFLGLIFPPACAACGKLLPSIRIGDMLCGQCLSDVEPVVSPVCTVCGTPFISSAGPDHICGICMKNRPAFHGARSLFIYRGTIRKLIHRAKFNGDGYALKALCRLSAKAMESVDLPKADMIIPVPLHISRLRSRGFNQAASMAGRLFPVKMVQLNLLSRTKRTLPQMNLSVADRHANIRGAFTVVPDILDGERLLIFDDILTTGSTAEGAAGTLEKAGAGRVDIFTLARTVKKNE